MGNIAQGFIVFILLFFVASCSDHLVEPETQARVSTITGTEMVAVPFQVDVDAVMPGPSVSKAATTDCTFKTKGTTMKLDADCTTDATIFIDDGMTLDGKGHTITAVDPPNDHFRGAVVANSGAVAHVKNLTVTASGLANVCDGGADRLRGIMFEGASGSITNNTVVGINQGASGCQEGNGIEVRNAPFDGTHPGTVTVAVSHNTITDYQKTGIVANGDVDVDISHNRLSASATQENLAANTIQLGFGALGTALLNNLEGNQWMGTSPWAATAILVFEADVVVVSKNHITGNSEIGIYGYGNGGLYEKNHITDEGADHPNADYDIGIGGWGIDNTFNKNQVSGFDVPFDPDPLPGSKNKAL